MKCSVPRCPDGAITPRKPRRGLVPPELPLCAPHRQRYVACYRRHFKAMFDNLQKPRVTRVTRGRPAPVSIESVVQTWATNGAGRERSWQSTWLQMVDCELLNSGSALGASRGRQTETGEWIPEGMVEEAPRSSYPNYVRKVPGALPEHATRAGQEAVARRVADQQLLEQRIAAETAEFAKGQRQVLELELKVKREVDLRRAAKRKP